MTPRARAAAYARAFPRWPPLRADDRWLDGVWIMGHNYRGTGFYGSYPPGYLARIQALFPDVWTRRGRAVGRVLHLFSGSLTTQVDGVRLDRDHRCGPSVAGDALALPFRARTFDHVLADPPYAPADAARYGTVMPDRRRVLLEAARVTKRGGHLVWMDEVLPIFSKRLWRWWGAIGLTLGTNRRGRFVFIFERVS